MAAYYNEIDPYAAAWLRNLIAAGLIPAGDVDERSIVDVRADDLRGYGQCHFFAGIGLLDMAFEEAGFVVVRGPDLLWGGDVKRFHPPAGKFDGVIGGPPGAYKAIEAVMAAQADLVEVVHTLRQVVCVKG